MNWNHNESQNYHHDHQNIEKMGSSNIINDSNLKKIPEYIINLFLLKNIEKNSFDCTSIRYC